MKIHQVLINDYNSLPENMPDFHEKCVSQIKKIYSDAEYHLYSGREIEDIIINNFDNDVFIAYKKLKPYACKADLARLCLLYLYGGIYIDLNVYLINKIPNLEYVDFFAFRDLSAMSQQCWAVQNGFMYSVKGCKVLKNAIDIIVRNCKIQYYGVQCVDVSATTVLGTAIVNSLPSLRISTKGQLDSIDFESLDDEFVEDIEKLGYNKKKTLLGFVMDDDVLIALRKPCGGGDIESVGFKGTNNYVQMWKTKEIYDQNYQFSNKKYLSDEQKKRNEEVDVESLGSRRSLEVVLRTHDGSNISKFPRFIKISKKDLILGCLTSLINSTNECKNNVKITILDDHSSQAFHDELKEVVRYSRHPVQIINLEKGGKNESALAQFERCKKSTADLVYCVEDDYLHSTNSIAEMLYEYDELSKKYNIPQPLCIFPWDQPEDYDPKHNTPEIIMRGKNRHWKTGWFTTFTMLTSPKVFNDYWEYFENLATNYEEWDGIGDKNDTIHEGNTISYIWCNHVRRINPIPSLALHMQSELQKDPYIDWEYWWKTYTHRISKVKMKYK